MHSTFKEIYKEQENLNHSPNALQDYLNSDGDTEPMIELNKRKINKQDSLKMEHRRIDACTIQSYER